jgi:hypothetical protein
MAVKLQRITQFWQTCLTSKIVLNEADINHFPYRKIREQTMLEFPSNITLFSAAKM